MVGGVRSIVSEDVGIAVGDQNICSAGVPGEGNTRAVDGEDTMVCWGFGVGVGVWVGVGVGIGVGVGVAVGVGVDKWWSGGVG